MSNIFGGSEEEVNYNICRTQGRIFEYAAKNGYAFPEFINLYMNSDFCRRAMDTSYSRFQLSDEEECWDFIEPEIGSQLHCLEGNAFFDIDIAYWIGFTYRQLYIETEIKSKELVTIISPDELLAGYLGLHTIDEENATDILCERHKIKKI